jgi:hypothetical protein
MVRGLISPPAAHAAVLELQEEMYAVGKEVLRGMREPMATLGLAICTSRRYGGRLCCSCIITCWRFGMLAVAPALC